MPERTVHRASLRALADPRYGSSAPPAPSSISFAFRRFPMTDAVQPAEPVALPEIDPAAAAARVLAALSIELAARPAQVTAAIALLDEGATVPFIARYRKEATGGLDDVQLRLLDERLRALRDLEDRRATVMRSVAGQGKLDDALREELMKAQTLSRIEDLYAPYKPKRRTKAMIAREAGLAPLAELLLAEPDRVPADEALPYVKEGSDFADIKSVLNGARDILAERFAEAPDLVSSLREMLASRGWVHARVVEGKEAEGAKFSDYFAHDERYAGLPSHRALAMLRGRNEGVLRVDLTLDEVPPDNPYSAPFNEAEQAVAAFFDLRDAGRPADRFLLDTVRWTWRTKLSVQLSLDLVGRLREQAELDAIRVFAENLKDLLLAAPAGARATLGLDPGLRTGVKVAVVDATGKVVATDTVYPHAPRDDWDGTIARLARLCAQHRVELVAIGNGTASRETEKLAKELAIKHPELTLTPVVVSEAGASVYSASEAASNELPDLDVSLRGAVSIARRLQDPLAELVKIDPKSIGVGQYQHDVNQFQLARSLDAVVEDCVNAVGVDLNTASPALLSRVSGLNANVARGIVAHRDANGPFRSRSQLRAVPRLGDKTFEQCAGFLRIPNGDDPLDASSVHPEAYGVVQRMLARLQVDARRLIGQKELLSKLKATEFVDERFGLPTVSDILRELEKPGRDPRPEFRTARFADGVSEVAHLKPGMVLEGVVTNVTAFGAFIDVGVHQDGLAHISELSDRFVKDPRDAVKAGQIVQARVLDVDVKRNRIALSLRKDAAGREAGEAGAKARPPAARDAGGGRGIGGGPGASGGRGPAGGSGAGAGGRAPGAGAANRGGSRGAVPANNALADALLKARGGK